MQAAVRHPIAYIALVPLAALALLLPGCGSKPAYCGKVNDFKDAVHELKQVDVKKSPAELPPAIKKVGTTGKAAVDATRSTYRAQADAVENSLKTLAGSLKQLADPKQRDAAKARLPDEASAVGDAVDELVKTTKSKCS